MIRMKTLAASALLACMACVPLAAAAEDMTADDAIKYRKQVMSAVGDHMKSIAQIVKGEVIFMDALPTHAKGLADVGKISLAAFEPEVLTGDEEKTTVTADIWSDWAGYEKSMAEMNDAADAFVAAVATGEKSEIGPALKTLGGTCKSCHDDFRDK